MHPSQRLINHVALVLDGSTSMNKHQEKLVQVADEQIKYLALRSEELSQETRVSVYLFGSVVSCLIFDMDVMRLPSIEDLYTIAGMTALVDATWKSYEDLATTSQIYGDHAFLTFVLTDGEENKSKFHNKMSLGPLLSQLGDNQTIGFLVPNRTGMTYMSRIGVEKNYCAVWDTNSTQGIIDAVSTIRTATDNFMTNRASGVRGTRNVFSTGAEAVNKVTVTQALTPLANYQYKIINVPHDIRIDEFINGWLNLNYIPGMGYYQLTKSETIQPQKKIIVVDKHTLQAYTGDQARGLIGLPAKAVRVKPDHNPRYDIFVQSTSINRKLISGTKLLTLSL